MLSRTERIEPTPAWQRAVYSSNSHLLPMICYGVNYEVNGKRLIDHLSFRLSAGPLTVVMGPNGAGKSLLLKLLHGLISPSSGKITWNGSENSLEIRRCQAMVLQKPVLLRRSVAANIDFVLRLNGKHDPCERQSLIKRVGLSEHASKPARKLSGGEQQCLALARALAVSPDILFLDEPTASLDPGSVLRIETIVREAHSNGTKIVFVTHDIGQARRLADEVIFMHRGRVAEHTPADRFFHQPTSKEAQGYLTGQIIL
jgi:tungstate transport system ATP-binding protein